MSAVVASLFSSHAQAYQVLGARAAVFHEQFVQALNTAAGSYAGAGQPGGPGARGHDHPCGTGGIAFTVGGMHLLGSLLVSSAHSPSPSV
ncbi:PE family protein [Mycobacterium simulans]|uniref:PE family protein n=1 Tax=Mycobacterium simulans TaxID=627089 RepID=UPI0028CB9215|nr:PE family protein [Mycobacterium simulans]